MAQDLETTGEVKAATNHAAELAKRDTALFQSQRQLEAQAREIEDLKAQLLERFTEMARLTVMLEDVKGRAEALQATTDALLGSTSWRVTQPLRALVTRLRNVN